MLGTYDFIIVGSGISGSTLGGRLSEVSEWDTLILEAGTFENNFTDIPAMETVALNSKYVWPYTSIPQTTCCLGIYYQKYNYIIHFKNSLKGFVEKKCPFISGKGFGGGSIINALIYSRGCSLDFNRWESDGNPGWDYKTVLKYFIKSENSTIIHGDQGYHGFDGPLNVQYHSVQNPQTKEFIEANKELGIEEIDINGHSRKGISRMQSNIRDGRRLSLYKAFLQPALNKKNLHLLPDSYVIKIYICDKSKINKVYFTRNGKLYVAIAKKEIILSAGAVSTPQILMLSGIGPADHLMELGIPVVQNLSVGKNLQNHPLLFGLHFQSNYSYTEKSIKENVKEYLHGKGSYTIARNIEAIGYYETEDNEEKGRPNIELLLHSPPIIYSYPKIPLGLTEESFFSLMENVNTATSSFIYIILLRPKSHGTIRLASKNPFLFPLIDTNFFSDPENKDLESMYNMVRFVYDKLAQTKSFKRMNARVERINIKQCKNFEFDSKDYWHCVIRHVAFNIFHPVGTAKMGPDPAKGAVVDARFKVYGFKSLRVVDASAMPFSISGHPAPNCIMMGERAYDFIREDYLKKG